MRKYLFAGQCWKVLWEPFQMKSRGHKMWRQASFTSLRWASILLRKDSEFLKATGNTKAPSWDFCAPSTPHTATRSARAVPATIGQHAKNRGLLCNVYQAGRVTCDKSLRHSDIPQDQPLRVHESNRREKEDGKKVSVLPVTTYTFPV